MGALGVADEALPVALEGKGNPLRNADRGEEAPAVQEAGLAGRETHRVDGQDAVIVKDEAMNHAIPRKLGHSNAEMRGGNVAQQTS